MNLDYITINGLDLETKKRMEEDIRKSNYPDNKTAYCVGLLRDGLDKREKLRELTSNEDVEDIRSSLKELKGKLESIEKTQCEEVLKEEVYRKLLIENYRLLIALCDAFTVDHEDIDDGKKDILPSNLLYQEKKLREAYRGL